MTRRNLFVALLALIRPKPAPEPLILIDCYIRDNTSYYVAPAKMRITSCIIRTSGSRL